MTQAELATRYGVTQATIGRVVRGVCWTHVETPAGPPPPAVPARGERVNTARLTAESVRAIRSAAATGPVSHRQMAARYGVSTSAIDRVISGQSWRHLDADIRVDTPDGRRAAVPADPGFPRCRPESPGISASGAGSVLSGTPAVLDRRHPL